LINIFAKKETGMKINGPLENELIKHQIRFYQLVNGYLAIGVIAGLVWILVQFVKLFV